MKVYIVEELLDSHVCGISQRLIGVYDSKEKALAEVAEIEETLVTDFFMSYMFDRGYEESDLDRKQVEEDCIHLYCDGNGDLYDLEVTECEVK